MLKTNFGIILLVIALSIASGLLDAQGFLNAAQIWREGNPSWRRILFSALGFGGGISIHFVTLKYLDRMGVQSAEVQSLVWFGITLVGVAIVSREFLAWNLREQIVGAAVLLGLAWLMVHTAK
jgi:hypothetical protein